MAWQRRVTAWFAARPRQVDVAVVSILLLGGALGAVLAPVEGSERSADWFAFVLVVGAVIPVWWRRSNPLVALPVSALFVINYWVLDYVGIVDVVLWLMFYSATRHGGSDRRRVWQVVAFVLAAVLLVATIGVIVPTEDLPTIALLAIFLMHGTAAVVGEALYQRSQYVAELEQRAEALEADLENKAALAAVEERTRIAREMHDIIAHGMSAIVVQAQGAQRMMQRDPDRAQEALRTIESIGRDSADEMRRMLGVLRDDGGGQRALEPQPGLDDLQPLRDVAEDAGVTTALTELGDPRPLPPGLELAAYRVVQEALTNVVRHAGRPTHVDITITHEPSTVHVSVVDDGLGAAAAPDSAGTGHGLLGMRERVEIYQGTVKAGPRPGGGFGVEVTLPVPARVHT